MCKSGTLNMAETATDLIVLGKDTIIKKRSAQFKSFFGNRIVANIVFHIGKIGWLLKTNKYFHSSFAAGS
jgi:hypothetical protein